MVPRLYHAWSGWIGVAAAVGGGWAVCEPCVPAAVGCCWYPLSEGSATCCNRQHKGTLSYTTAPYHDSRTVLHTHTVTYYYYRSRTSQRSSPILLHLPTTAHLQESVRVRVQHSQKSLSLFVLLPLPSKAPSHRLSSHQAGTCRIHTGPSIQRVCNRGIL